MKQSSRDRIIKLLRIILLAALLSIPALTRAFDQLPQSRAGGNEEAVESAGEVAVAQPAPALDSEGIERLVQDSGGTAEVSLNRVTGAVSFIRLADGAALSLVEGASVENKAAAFFNEYGSIFGLTNVDAELELVDSTIDYIGQTRLTYRQLYQGVPVFAGMLRLHFDAREQLTAANGTYIPGIALSVKPAWTAEAASAIAVDTVLLQNGLTGVSTEISAVQTNLTIFQAGLVQRVAGQTHLAYEVEVANPSLSIREFVYIDAHTGKVIDQITGIHGGLDRKVSETNLGNVIWEDSSGDPDPIPSGWAGGSAQQVTDWQNEIDGARETYNLFASMTGGTYLSYDGADATMRTVNNDPNIFCPNANWNGVSTNYCSGVTGDDTVAHEWGHAYTDFTSDLIYQWQSGALNESYSDIWGEVVDFVNGRGSDSPGGPRTDGSCSIFGSGNPSVDNSYRWLSGEDDPAFGGAIRDLWNPVCYNDPGKVTDTGQYICSTADSGGVHTNSGVPNHAFALMVDGGNYNGETIAGIGLTKSAHIHWQAQNMLTPASNFVDHADALEAACTSLIGIDLNTLDTDSTAGVPSGEVISAADCSEVTKVVAAVELRTEPTFCGFQPLLDPNAPPLCQPGEVADTINLQDWEAGLGSWTTGTREVANPATFDTPDWAVVSDLPDERPGQAAFVLDSPDLGDCAGDTEAGVLYLQSPVISIPASADPPLFAFDHWVATELGWDGGNVKISVNGGSYQLIPSQLFNFNPYNDSINSPGQGNDNPLAGEDGFTGTDGGTVSGSWGQTQIDLSRLVDPGDNIQIRFEMGLDGCNGVIGWYVDDVHTYTCSVGVPTPTNTPTVGPTPTSTNTSTPGPTPTNTPPGGGSFTFNPEADALVAASAANRNFGSRPFLYVSDSPEMRSYLRFDVQGLSAPVTAATLRMFVDSGTAPFEVHGVADNTWGESSITFNNAPPVGALINNSGGVSPGTTVDVDVTAYVTGPGLHSFVLTADSAGQIEFSSKEGGNPPELIIQTGAAGTPTPTNTPGPSSTPTATNTPGPTSTATNTPTPTATPGGALDVIYMSANAAGSVGGVTYDSTDILAYDLGTGSWSLYFDGSDVGLSGANVGVFSLLPDGTLLLSLENASFSIPDVGLITDSDIVQFTAVSLGSDTSGSFAWYFDGSDVQLTTSSEGIDALHVLANGDLIISTEGNTRVDGIARVEAEDLIRFTPAGLGSTTTGSWSFYFDGSDVGLGTTSDENLTGLWIDELTGEIYLTTTGVFSVSGLSGDGADVFICVPGSLGDATSCTYSLFWDGSANGLAGQSIDGLSLAN